MSFISRGNQHESDSDQDMDDFLDESSDEDDSASESWTQGCTPYLCNKPSLF